jgi:polar amino acid transport system permease protein
VGPFLHLMADLTHLGPFAPRTGRPVLSARIGIAAAIAAGICTVARILEFPTLGDLAVPLGLLGLSAGLVGRYQALAHGLPGQRMATRAAALGFISAVVAFFMGAHQAGTLRLDRFGRAYLDLEILKALPAGLLRGLRNTLGAAALAEVLAIVIGLVIALLAISPRKRTRYPAVVYTDMVRGLPLLVLTSLVFFGTTKIGLRLEPFHAIVISLAINASAYCAEIFRAGIQAIPAGQMEAARSLGMPHILAMQYIVVPQAVRQVIPPLVSEFIALIKDTAIVFFIVGFTARTADVFGVARTAAASTFSPTPYLAAAITYLIFTVPLARLVGKLEHRMRSSR